MKWTIILLILFLVGCSDGTKRMTNNATFSSMDSCLDSIKSNTGASELDPMIDEIGHISGFIRGGRYDGENFSCKTEGSGTQGIYVAGYYTETVKK